MMTLSRIKKTASGPDCIPYWVWKANATILAPIITTIWNFSIYLHTCPKAWKEANINPLLKVDAPSDYPDYRESISHQ